MITRILELSAHRRGVVLCCTALAAILAVIAMGHVKLDATPDLTEPQVILFTEWMGRSPTLVEDQVTYPLVSSLVAAPKVTDVRGYSMFGMSFVYVLFEEGTDLYWARSRVLEYVQTAKSRLPADAETSLGPDATGVGWVLQYTLEDDEGTLGLDGLRSLQDFTLRYALSSVKGVAEVASIGGYERQYQVTVDPARLRALSVTFSEVARAVRSSSSEVGGRVIELSGREHFVRGRGYVKNLDDLEEVVVRNAGASGPSVLVRDIGSVRFGPDIRRGLLEWNGDGEAVGGIIVMRYGENAREVIERVKAKLDELKPGLPKSLRIELAYDRSALIDRAIDTLKHTLTEEMLVVSAAIVLFLLHFRSALLPILSLPLAVSLAFIPMWLFDIPATIMSLGGIAIAIGATVDAEIVMIEAAHKKLEHLKPGQDRRKLLAEAAREVTPAIFFSLLVIAVSFLPVFALNGQAGRLFRPLAYTKTFVMLASALLSITFAPALRDSLLRGRIRPENKHPISRLIRRIYEPFVYVALRRPWSTIAIGVFALLSAIPLAHELGEEFMPTLDEGDLLYMPTTLPGIAIEEAKHQQIEQDRRLRSFPEVASVFGKAGRAESATDPAPLSMVETTLRLKPRDEWRLVRQERFYSTWAPDWLKRALHPILPEQRSISLEELSSEMNRVMQFPGYTNAWTMPIKARIDMQSTGIRTPIGVKIFGATLDEIEAVGTALEPVLREVPGTRSVLYERNLGGAYVDIVPDREKLAQRGLSIEDVQEMVEAGVGGAIVGSVIERRARYGVQVRLPRESRDDLEALRRIEVPLGMGANGSVVTLGDVCEVRIVSGPPMIREEDGLLVGYVYVDLEPSAGDLGGYVRSAQAHVNEAITSARVALTPGTFLKWSGQYEQIEEMRARMKILIPLTLVIVFALLYFHFGNVMEVLIVLLSIPFALVGSVWMLWLLDYRLSTAVWIGIIALTGLATQTGVVMIVYIDAAYERRKRAGKIRDLSDIIWAHMEGTVQRVRPKLMTVSTMLLGLLPLLWATGSGADVMKRIAAPMVGGLLTSAFLTLEIIPVIYTAWRHEQLIWERLATQHGADLARLEACASLFATAACIAAATAIAPIYVDVDVRVQYSLLVTCALALAGASIAYLTYRRPAKLRAFAIEAAAPLT